MYRASFQSQRIQEMLLDTKYLGDSSDNPKPKKQARRMQPFMTSTQTVTTLPPTLPNISRAPLEETGFSLVRRYSLDDAKRIWNSLKNRLQNDDLHHNLRIVDFGAEDGYMLNIASEILKSKAITYIGIEGGSRVGAPSYFLQHAQNKALQNDVTFYGLDAEYLFEEIKSKNHPIISLDIDKMTIAHCYDGGTLSQEVASHILGVINEFQTGSWMVFVTTCKGTLGPNGFANYEWIVKHMRPGWNLQNSFQVKEYDAVTKLDAEEATMTALLFQKK